MMEDARGPRRGPENEPTRSATSINSSKLNSGAMLSAKALSVSDLIKNIIMLLRCKKHVSRDSVCSFHSHRFGFSHVSIPRSRKNDLIATMIM